MKLRPLPVVLVTVATVLAVLALGVTGAPFTSSSTPSGDGLMQVSGLEPAAGGTVCVTGADAFADEADLLLLAAGDAGTDTDAAARGVVLTLGGDDERDPERRSIGPLAPGGLEQLGIMLGADAWLWTGWADLPLAAWQEWRTDGAPGQPRGAVASACLPTDASVQTVLGMRTDGGHEALLRLANPFEADATFALTLVTLDGAVEPVALRNISVPGGERVTVRLNDHVPEQSDLAAIVTVGAGRLAVEGLQRSVAAVGGIEGLAAVPPVTEPAVTWTFPWAVAGPDVEGSIWLLNPEPRTVVVSVTTHTPQGAAVPQLDSIELGPGALVRVDTADLMPDSARSAGLTLRSETTGVLAAAGAAFLAADPALTGLVRYAGSPVLDGEWSLAGVAAPGRDTSLHVVNLSDEDADLRVTLTTLSRAASAVDPGEGDGSDGDAPTSTTVTGPAASRTVVLTPGRLAPGATARVILPLDGARAYALVVEGGPALVVSRTTTGRELLEPVALSATPSQAWRTVTRPLVGRPLTGWVASLATGSAVDGAGERVR